MLSLPTKFVDETRLIEDALDIVLSVRKAWTVNSVKSKLFTNGITNKLAGFWAADDPSQADMLLVRVYGQVCLSTVARLKSNSHPFIRRPIE